MKKGDARERRTIGMRKREERAEGSRGASAGRKYRVEGGRETDRRILEF